MGKLLVVFRREYLERVRSKWFLLGTLLGPVFFLLVAGAPRLIGDRPAERSRDLARIEVIDATGLGFGARVVTALRERYPLSRTPYLQTVDASEVRLAEDRALLRVQREEVLGYLVLDSATAAGRSVRYEGRNAGAPRDVAALQDVVRRQVLASRMEREGIDAERVLAISRFPLEILTQQISDKGREKGSG